MQACEAKDAQAKERVLTFEKQRKQAVRAVHEGSKPASEVVPAAQVCVMCLVRAQRQRLQMRQTAFDLLFVLCVATVEVHHGTILTTAVVVRHGASESYLWHSCGRRERPAGGAEGPEAVPDGS